MSKDDKCLGADAEGQATAAPPLNALAAARQIVAQADIDQPFRAEMERDFLDEVAEIARAYIKAVEARDDLLKALDGLAEAISEADELDDEPVFIAMKAARASIAKATDAGATICPPTRIAAEEISALRGRR